MSRIQTKNELVNYCKQLSEDTELAAKMGQAARETIVSKFSYEKFAEAWNDILMKVYRNEIKS